MELILASGSPRRSELLTHMGLRFRVQPADVEELTEADPQTLVLHNAALKADAVSRLNPATPVLAADTTVALGGLVLNKPADLEEARSMLLLLSGQTHAVFTGVSLRWAEQDLREDFVETSHVTFRELDEDTITAYFKRVDPLDKAGAYGIQEGRELIVEKWTGSLHNIIGLPTERLENVLRNLNWLNDLQLKPVS
ncbi:MAG: septum formation protein [Puniceicoccaceae bacterium 5H]|nr:MAG: septum formation protein [Puniceicoccaceae bacterium 5H]